MFPLRSPAPRALSIAGLGWVTLAVVMSCLAAAGGSAPAARPSQPPRPSPAARAAYNAAAALQNRGAWDLAAAAWEAMLRDHPRDALAATATYNLGICRAEEGKWPDAERAFRSALDAADQAIASAAAWELGRGLFTAARGAPEPEAFRRAAETLRAFLDRPPPKAPPEAAAKAADRRAAARSLLAEALWQTGDKPGALAEWDRFLRDHPESPRLAEVLYALGVARGEAGDDAGASAAFARFAERFSAHELADEVAVRRADLALAAGKPADAARLVVEVAKRADGPLADEALDRLATALLKQDRHAAAAAAFDMLADRRGAAPTAAEARLSAAAAWDAAGKPEEARTRLRAILESPADRAPAATVAEAAARLARSELSSNAAERALAAADRGLAAAPADATVAARLVYARAEALVALPGRRDEAVSELDRLVADHPDDPRVGPALALLGSLALDAGRPAEARRAAERFLALPPERRGDDEPTVRALRAEALLALGDAAGAAADYADLMRAGGGDPRRAHWRLRSGAALVAAEAWPAAHDALGTLASAARGASGLDEAEVPLALLLDATALLELGRPEDALPLLERLERDHRDWPRRPEARLVSIRAKRDAGDVAGARRIAEELARSLAPDDALAERAWFRLGQSRQEDADPAGAVEALREARRLAPESPRVAAGLLAEGWCHDALGDLAAAERAWSEVVDRHAASPLLAEALLARADLRLRSGAPEEGLADAERVIDSGKGSSPAEALFRARLVAGLCLSAAGRPAEGAGRLAALAADAPDFDQADRVLLELALARTLAGDPAGAETALDDLRSRFPGSPLVGESWLETAEGRFAAADWEGAAEACRRALDTLSGDDPAAREEALHRLAWTFAMRRDSDGAAEAFAAQLAASPSGARAADARVMLGDALFRTGKVAEAAEALAGALAAPELVSSADLVGLATVRAAECDAKREDFEASLRRLEGWLPTSAGPEVSARTRGLARFARASAFHGLDRPEDALGEFRSLADDALAAEGQGELAARARLMEGEMLFELGRHAEAIASFFKVAYGFGDREAPALFHPWQAQATFEAARCCDVLGKPEQARGLYAELLDRHPGSPYEAAARLRLDALNARK